MEITGTTLTQMRGTLGLSQPALGEKLGVHKNTVGRWETDRNTSLQVLAYWALKGLLAERATLEETA